MYVSICEPANLCVNNLAHYSGHGYHADGSKCTLGPRALGSEHKPRMSEKECTWHEQALFFRAYALVCLHTPICVICTSDVTMHIHWYTSMVLGLARTGIPHSQGFTEKILDAAACYGYTRSKEFGHEWS